jgi:hypothetical protein
MFRKIKDKIFTVQQIFKMVFQLTHQKKKTSSEKNNCMLLVFFRAVFFHRFFGSDEPTRGKTW